LRDILVIMEGTIAAIMKKGGHFRFMFGWFHRR
jgi:hypothetical protein